MKFFEQIFNKKNLEQSKGEIQEKAKQEKQENIEKKEIFINNGYLIIQDDKSIELINLEKNLDPEVLQRAYNQLLENNTFEDIEKVIELADKKNLELVPDSKSLQLAFERAIYGMFDYDGFENVEKIENLAKEHNIELHVNNDAMVDLNRECCNAILKRDFFDVTKIQEFSDFANERGIEIEITQDILQEIFDNARDAYTIQKIEKLANERGIEIDITQDKLQEIFDSAYEISDMQKVADFADEKGIKLERIQDKLQETLDDMHSFPVYFYVIQEVVDLANKRGINLEITQDTFQEAYHDARNINMMQEVEDLANKRGINLEITQIVRDKIQDSYCYYFYNNNIEGMQKIEDFANERGVKLERTQDTFQKIFDAEVSNKANATWVRYNISKALESAEKFGIKIEIKKEIIQQAFENLCMAFSEAGSLNPGDIEEIQEISQEHGVELENVKELIERAYIGIIHNKEMGHVDSRRNTFLEMLQKVGSNLAYEDVAKMDYLKYLEVPKNEILDIEKTITINDSPIDVVFQGRKGIEFFDQVSMNRRRKSVGMNGKFIMGTTKDDNLKFVFDSTLGEHTDIATKYDLKALGGGWIRIDEQNKTISISGTSQKFGVEPRSISRQIVADVFPEYELSVE